jgi:poly-gamma-glutamate capsule biosynthesis protein CapA/YwtB (metallophosphatase superfamily)
MTTTIGLTGDVMLGRKVDESQRQRPVDAVWGDLRSHLQSLDGLCINLECCLSTRGSPWQRTRRPFHFRADPGWAVPALGRAGVDYASLANNHLLDFEEEALLDTVDALTEADIAHAGAGRTVAAAREPALFSIDGLDVAVVSLTDNTPEYAADRTSPGVAHLSMDLDESERETVRAILDRARRADPDLLVASLHWGPNMVTVPAEHFRAFGRFLVEEGVDLIHGHSAHVFQGIEVSDGVPICYDCGDFVDDYRVDGALRNDRSFLFEVTVEDGAVTRLRLRPVEIAECAVHWADDDTARWCRERMRERSRPFGTGDEFERAGNGLALPVA